MKWTRDGDAWVSSEFRIEVVGATSTGRATVWALKHRGRWVEQVSRRLGRRTKTFERLRDAKKHALKILQTPTQQPLAKADN